MKRPRAATLAVGTEVTDGQIIDSNSAWISARLVACGIEVIEHRSVPDDRSEIERALHDLKARADLLFVTGGLGPTSDDFTREVIAKSYGRALEFDPGSWVHIEQTLKARGVPVREIQRSQCYFPEGARVLTNPAGTANAFALPAADGAAALYALPGPPVEISAVWGAHLASELESWVPLAERETLVILRCLGRGESQIAETVEEVIAGEPLRVGYRAHVPYVEVKLWSFPRDRERVAKVIAELETRLKEWIVNRNVEDVADRLLSRATTAHVHIEDRATQGVLADRLARRIRESRREGLKLSVSTTWGAGGVSSGLAAAHADIQVLLDVDEAHGRWLVRLTSTEQMPEKVIEVTPHFHYKLDSERARRTICERLLILFGQEFGG